MTNQVDRDAMILEAIEKLSTDFKKEINEIKVSQQEIKEDLAGFKLEMKTELSDFKLEMKTELSDIKGELKAIQGENAGTIKVLEMQGERTSDLSSKMTLLDTRFNFQTNWFLTIITLLAGGVIVSLIKMVFFP